MSVGQQFQVQYIPNEVVQYYGTITNGGINVGNAIINILQANLCPFESEGDIVLKADQTWRLIISASVVPSIFSMLLVIFKYKHLSLKEFLESEKDEKKACNELRKVYNLDDKELMILKDTLF